MEMATLAVNYDVQGDAANAIKYYRLAAAELAKGPQDADTKAKIEEYTSRANALAPNAQMEQMQAMASAASMAQSGAQVAGQLNQGAQKAGGMKVLGGAAAVGGGIGLLLSGPILAVAGAGAAAYAATKAGPGGDAARSVGNAANVAMSEAQDINKKHNITGKLMDAGSSLATKAKELNDKYKIQDKVVDVTKTGIQQAKIINEKHKIVDRVASGVAMGADRIAKGLGGSAGQSQPATLPAVPR
eukprot:CAMPEP_0182858422 /NCGR_PEP_ID=MMETSP0034_2-20130328/3672_1 /TAXON_ID=156128 /ORGANISM="Nephroselmis pyriformis, Strain CCMP717" /LENGTH=243 /DNA_ID=CAMNT_0024989849 /DNA_START=133 /DNA_END=867 /DNA_ORIENTATION=+